MSHPSYIVDVDRRERGVAAKARTAATDKTTAIHGLHQDELKRLRNAVYFMLTYCRVRKGRGRLWLVSTNRGMARGDVSDIWKRITKLQKQFGLAPYSVLTFETLGGQHAHIVFVGKAAIAEKLKAAVFGNSIDVRPAVDPMRLVEGYLAKERTSQANYGRRFRGGRIKGSHRLEGGGDRVRPSAKLKADAIAAGYMQPWARDNARRTETRKEYRPRPLTRRAPKESGQIVLPLPGLSKPIARLHSFGGGLMPKAVADEVEFRRERLKLSQEKLAALIGLSQGHYANIIRGHDRISARSTQRLRELLLSPDPSQLQKYLRKQGLGAKNIAQGGTH